MATSKIGIWLVGARGGVATTLITGLCALKDGLVPDAGLASFFKSPHGVEEQGFIRQFEALETWANETP